MFNLQCTLDIIEAAKSDTNFDQTNAIAIADLYGRSVEDVQQDIIVKRKMIADKKKAESSVNDLKTQLDKYI
jgi:hypothetical protein